MSDKFIITDHNKMNELIYGIHSVKSILDAHPEQILRINVICKPVGTRFKSLIKQISINNINLETRTRQWLDNKVKGALHQGIVAEVLKIPDLTEDDLLNFLKICSTMPLLLILDGIVDPHNVGACLRSAEAAGVHMVIITRHRSAQINSTVRKVSSGSADRVPCIRVTNLSRTLKLLQQYGIWIVGTIVRSSYSIFNAKLVGPLALVVGSEEFGIRKLTKKHCDELISIPMTGSISSLNVSVATGICLFEIVRQRRYQRKN